MGVWGNIFGWRALFRWDVLGTVVPGIFVAVGLGVLGVDWFPYHLLLAQTCFSVAALLCLIKVVGYAVESKDTIKSRLAFGVTLGLFVIALAVWVDYAIQMEHVPRAVESSGRRLG
jgi:Na+-translocating ferredoxin:NAD+ oxidoreductase RnfD subunit